MADASLPPPSSLSSSPTMRLDKFLWFVRLSRTRSAAQALATTGHLRIDGRAIDRAHACVRVGQVLTFAQGSRIRVVRIEALPHRRGPAPEAQACLADLAPDLTIDGRGGQT